MAQNPMENCWCLSLCSVNTSTQFYTSHFYRSQCRSMWTHPNFKWPPHLWASYTTGKIITLWCPHLDWLVHDLREQREIKKTFSTRWAFIFSETPWTYLAQMLFSVLQDWRLHECGIHVTVYDTKSSVVKKMYIQLSNVLDFKRILRQSTHHTSNCIECMNYLLSKCRYITATSFLSSIALIYLCGFFSNNWTLLSINCESLGILFCIKTSRSR